MTDYEKAKAECWEEFKRTNLDGEVQWQPVNRYDVFCAAFDRAYALGKQEKDAEEEEILTCEKSKAMQLYSRLLDLVENERMCEHYSEWCNLEREYIALFGENVFTDYFSSKCLPDAREFNFGSTESKSAEPKNEGTRQEQYVPKNAESGTHSLNSSFSQHNRLHIATLAMQGILTSAVMYDGCYQSPEITARMALKYADALIDKCEKGASK